MAFKQLVMCWMKSPSRGMVDNTKGEHGDLAWHAGRSAREP